MIFGHAPDVIGDWVLLRAFWLFSIAAFSAETQFLQELWSSARKLHRLPEPQTKSKPYPAMAEENDLKNHNDQI